MSAAGDAETPQDVRLRPARAKDAVMTIHETTTPDAASGYFDDASATLGDRIAAARGSTGLTQSGLAARLGVSAKVVSGWENDRSEPRANRLAMLSGMLGVSVAWLLTGMGDGVPEPDAGAAPGPAPVATLALPIAADGIEAAERFLTEGFGAPTRRTEAGAVAANLFGVDVSFAPHGAADLAGVRLALAVPWAEWRAVFDRLRASGAAFEAEPSIQGVGAPDEAAEAAVRGPGGVILALRAVKAGSGA